MNTAGTYPLSLRIFELLASKVLFSILILSFSLQALAEKDKKVYAEEALRGLSSYFYFLSNQENFTQSLTPEEREQAFYIRNLLNQYERERWPRGGGTIRPFPLVIEFSSDQEKFRRKPNEPIRSAITTRKKHDPIWFNLKKLNAEKVSFLDVIQIMIHEVGHKLGDAKRQSAVDSLASKVRIFLESFFTEKKSSEGMSVQMLSIPFEFQTVGTYEQFYLREIHLFVETEATLQRIPYDFSRHYTGRHDLGFYTGAHGGGIGNILSNQSYVVRDVELGPPDTPLDLQLTLEVQNRLFYMVPEQRLVPGPINDDGRQTMYPKAYYVNLVPPEAVVVKVPIWAFFDFTGGLAFNFFEIDPSPWSYQPYQGKLPVQNRNDLVTGDGLVAVEVSFAEALPVEIKSLALEVTSEAQPLSYLVEAQNIDAKTYRFEIPKSILPERGGVAEGLVINSSFSYPLKDIVSLKSYSTKQDKKALKSGRVSIVDDEGKLIPYTRKEKISSLAVPLTLEIPINFEPAQVRLRWIKGSDMYYKDDSASELYIGRLSRIQEEKIANENYEIIDGSAGEQVLRIKSLGVHLSVRFDILLEKFFYQKDEGLRELKEVILVSKDGQMYHDLTPNRIIYNGEHLKVIPSEGCDSLLIE